MRSRPSSCPSFRSTISCAARHDRAARARIGAPSLAHDRRLDRRRPPRRRRDRAAHGRPHERRASDEQSRVAACRRRALACLSAEAERDRHRHRRRPLRAASSPRSRVPGLRLQARAGRSPDEGDRRIPELLLDGRSLAGVERRPRARGADLHHGQRSGRRRRRCRRPGGPRPGLRGVGHRRPDAGQRHRKPRPERPEARRAAVRRAGGADRLVLVFGSVVAGLVPLLMAILSIVVALGLVALFSQAFDLATYIFNMLTGMGLALGIDYSLFVISRYREERGHGLQRHDAIAASGATASRAVFFSGTAFVVAMCGMLIVPNNIMRSLALGAILVGIVSVIAALTLLPALLGLLGDRVNALRIPFVGRASLEAANPEGRFWHAVVERVLKHPALSLALAGGVLVAAAIPVLGLDIGTNGVSTLPDRLASKRGFIALERNFPRVTTDPAEVVVAEGYGSRADEALMRLRDRLATDPRFGRGQVIVAAN